MGVVVLIERPGLRLAADRKVLKSREAYVVADVNEAYVRVQEQIEAEMQRVDQFCAKLASDAYREGLTKAQEDAARTWTLTQADQRALLNSLQPVLVEIILEAVAFLVKGLDRQAFFARALERLQESLREVSWARLRVHPDSVEAAQAALSEFERVTGLGKLARVSADESLPPEGCILESQLGQADASLDMQIGAVRGAIAEAARGLATSLRV
jgi:type III secretion protein L